MKIPSFSFLKCSMGTRSGFYPVLNTGNVNDRRKLISFLNRLHTNLTVILMSVPKSKTYVRRQHCKANNDDDH